jgi:hypothetical protein
MYWNNRMTDFSKMELWLEFKYHKDSDGFRDPEGHSNPSEDGFRFEHDSEESQLTRGQLASYAAAHMGTQFHVHAFSLLICGSFARFIRWDRAAAIVSQRFDYTKQSTPLADFFWRYSRLGPDSRGCDTSVTNATPGETSFARKHLMINDPSRTFMEYMVPGGGNYGYYIAPSPKYTSRSPFGRATRAFSAYDLRSNRVVFLKDYWRIAEPGMEKEGDIYAQLEEHNVPHIAPFDRGDDVLDHITIAQTLTKEPWACLMKKIPHYKHYRMTLNLVGRDITSFKSSWEFVNAIADAMEGQRHWPL